MSLDVGVALRNGLSRTFERNGLLLIGLFVVVGFVSMVATQSLNAAIPRALNASNATTVGGAGGESLAELTATPTPFALSLPLPAVVALVLGFAVVAEILRIVAVRTLVSEEIDRIPREYTTHNIGFATLHSVVGNLVVSVLILLGLLLLILPGVFLAVAFFFVRQEIAVADKSFVDAMADSWTLSKGSRLEVFGLVVIVFGIGVAASSPAIALVLFSPAVGAIASVLVGGVTTVFGIAVAARAYDQLRAAREERVGALGPDDIEEPSI